MSKNPKTAIKGLLSEVGHRDELLINNRNVYPRERKQPRAQEVVEA
jgi:hypothetical protein